MLLVVTVLLELAPLAVEIRALGVGLGADRHVFAGSHRHRSGDEPGHGRGQHGAMCGVCCRDPDDQAGRGDDSVIRTEDRGSEPADLRRAMFL